MIATEEMAGDLAPCVERPSTRTLELPRGSSAADRDALVQAIAEALLEIRSWPNPGAIGDSSFLILETEIGAKTFYVQFLSEPTQRSLLCEIASGFYGRESEYRASPLQTDAMVSHGFSDGRQGNFRKELVFDAPDAAQKLAGETLSLLGNVFGWAPESRITAKISHAQRGRATNVFDALSCANMVELLARNGIEAEVRRSKDGSSENATVEATLRGRSFSIHFADRVNTTSRYRAIVARAQVGRNVDPLAANPFNALTELGRSWVDGGCAYVAASLCVAGITEDAVRQWLQRWDDALTSAANWYRRVELSDGEEIALGRDHFSPHFHNLQRIVRCHVKPAAEEAAIAAFFEDALPDESGRGIDAWAFFERYAAVNPELAVPIAATFVSSARAEDIIPWLERMDGVTWKATVSGELEIRHSVGEGTLVLSPALVRRVAVSAERFALLVTLERTDGEVEVEIGTDAFRFSPNDARIVIGAVTFVVPEMPLAIGWFEAKQRLRAIERQLAWAGPIPCSGPIAWMQGALAGAERIGIACGPERARFDDLVAAARRCA